MGSRTVWKIATNDEIGIHLYSHWGGSDKIRITAEALLRAESRWDDPTYFTRIFTSWVINDGWDTETGHGLWAGRLDLDFFEESYNPVTIYPDDNLVNWGGETFTFTGFIEMAREKVGIAEGVAT